MKTFRIFYEKLKISCDSNDNNITIISCWRLCIRLGRYRKCEIINTYERLWSSRGIECIVRGTTVYFRIESTWLGKSRSCRVSRICKWYKSITISKSIYYKIVEYDSTTCYIGHTTICRTSGDRCSIYSICTDFYIYCSCRCRRAWEISESERTRTRDSHIECRKDTTCDDDAIDRATGTWSDEGIIPVDRSSECTTSDDSASTDLRSRNKRKACSESNDRYSCEKRAKRYHI